MKFKKPSQKLIIALFLLFGLFIIFILFQNNNLKPKNEKQIVENYFRNILKNSYNCSLYAGKINESLLQDKFDKRLIIEGLNYCKKSVKNLNKVNVPIVKSKENYLLLQKLKQEVIKNSKCNVIEHEYLLKDNNLYKGNHSPTKEIYEKNGIKCNSEDLTIFEIIDKLSLIYDKR